MAGHESEGASAAAGSATGAGDAGAANAGASSEASAAATADKDDASVVVENGVVKFYFASGKADLAPGAVEALGDAIAAGKAGKKLVLSGFHDATGDPAKNAELAKKRAFAVRDALKAAGGGVTVSVLQNVYAEDMVHAALPEATVDQYESVDLMYQALNSGRADAAATDQSSLAWFMTQSPGRYKDAGYGWNPQSYSCAVKPGEQRWLNFVNSVFHEAMTGVEFNTYAASFKQWFGVDLDPPQIGFPIEYR